MRKKEKEGDLNIYSTKNLLSFPTKVNNNNNNNKKKTKHLECKCWVCKILNSSTTSVTNNKIDTTTTATKRYESYNIVSETGDSFFYDPLISSSIFNIEYQLVEKAGQQQIYVAEDRILDFVQQDELLAKHFSGVNFKQNEY